jgi:hypothetical protein
MTSFHLSFTFASMKDLCPAKALCEAFSRTLWHADAPRRSIWEARHGWRPLLDKGNDSGIEIADCPALLQFNATGSLKPFESSGGSVGDQT